MKDIYQSRIASLLTIVAGAWLMLSPLAITMSGAALVSILITGGVIALVGLVQLFWMNTLPSWVSALAAIWLFVAAFIFSASTAAILNQTITATIAFVIAVWDGLEVGEVQNERRHMHV